MGTRIAPALHGSVGAVGPVGSVFRTARHQGVVTDHNAPCLHGRRPQVFRHPRHLRGRERAALVPPGPGRVHPHNPERPHLPLGFELGAKLRCKSLVGPAPTQPPGEQGQVVVAGQHHALIHPQAANKIVRQSKLLARGTLGQIARNYHHIHTQPVRKPLHCSAHQRVVRSKMQIGKMHQFMGGGDYRRWC